MLLKPSILLLLTGSVLGGMMKTREVMNQRRFLEEAKAGQLQEALAMEQRGDLSDKFEGDFLLSEDQKAQIVRDLGLRRMRRNAVPDVRKLWPNKTLIYNITVEDFDDLDLNAIQDAMDDITSQTCIIFRQKTPADVNWVQIRGSSSGCNSYIGVQGKGQNLNLDPVSCLIRGAIVHEFMHTLGFYHQHAAMERDNYININWANIYPSMAANFNKQANTNNLGVAYDYGSVLHYAPSIYSKNGLPSISLLQPTSLVVGQRKGPTASDILKLNRLYSCPGFETY